jgi:hypothetical protein
LLNLKNVCITTAGLVVSSLTSGLIASIFFANSTIFGLESNWLNCSSSESDLIIIPLLFFMVVKLAFTSIAIDGGVLLNVGNFNRYTPCMLVAFFSQLWPSLRN